MGFVWQRSHNMLLTNVSFSHPAPDRISPAIGPGCIRPLTQCLFEVFLISPSRPSSSLGYPSPLRGSISFPKPVQDHKKGLPLTPFVGRHAADVGLLLVYLHERQIGIKRGRCRMPRMRDHWTYCLYVCKHSACTFFQSAKKLPFVDSAAQQFPLIVGQR